MSYTRRRFFAWVGGVTSPRRIYTEERPIHEHPRYHPSWRKELPGVTHFLVP